MTRTIPTFETTNPNIEKTLPTALAQTFAIVDDRLFQACFDDIKSAIDLKSTEDAHAFFEQFLNVIATTTRPVRQEAFFEIIDMNAVIATQEANTQLSSILADVSQIPQALHGLAAMLTVISQSEHFEVFATVIDIATDVKIDASTATALITMLNTLNPEIVRPVLTARYLRLRDLRKLTSTPKSSTADSEETPKPTQRRKRSTKPSETIDMSEVSNG